MMNKENIKSLLIWLAIIVFCSALMTFSFYIILFALPLFILAAALVLPFNIYKSLWKQRAFYYKNTREQPKVSDFESEVVSETFM